MQNTWWVSLCRFKHWPWFLLKKAHNLWMKMGDFTVKSFWSEINRESLIILVVSAPLISSTNSLQRISCQVTKLFKTFPLFASQNVPVPRCVDTPIHSIFHFLHAAYFTAWPTTLSFGRIQKYRQIKRIWWQKWSSPRMRIQSYIFPKVIWIYFRSTSLRF